MQSSNQTTPTQPRWVAPVGTLWLLAFSGWFYSFDLPNNATISRLDIIVAVPDLLKATLFPEQGLDQGWILLAERVPLGALSLAIVVAALALGRLILRGSGYCSSLDFSTRLALGGGLGLSMMSLLTLALGLAGCLSRGLLGTLLIAAFVIESWLTWRDGRICKTANSSPVTETSPFQWRWGATALMIPFLAIMFVGALLPSMDFDVKEYHLEGPKEYFLQGRITLLSHNVYTSFPFLTEMLTLTGMVLRNDWYWGAIVGKGVLSTFAFFTAVGLFAYVKQLVGENAAWLAAALYLTTPWVYRISIIAYTEGALCAYVMLTLLAFDTALRQWPKTPFRWWIVVGFLAGSAASTKYPGLVFVAIPFGCALLFAAWRRLRSSPTVGIGRLAWAYVLGILLAFGPWLAKNVVETGNPVYPLGWSVFGGIDWDAELNAKFKAGHAAPVHLFTDPPALVADLLEKLIDVTAKSDWQNSLILGLAPFAWLATDRARVRWVALYLLVFFLLWFSITHRIDRFWVPLLPLFCVLAACGGDGLRRCWQLEIRQEGYPMPVVLTGIGLMSAVVLLTTIYNFAFMTSGVCGPNNYLSSYAAVQTQAYSFTPLIAHLGELRHLELEQGNPPPKTLLIGEAQVFDLHGDYVYNTVFDYSIFEQWTSEKTESDGTGTRRPLPAEAVHAKLIEEGVTHVAVNWLELLRYRTTYGYTEYVTPERFEDLVDAKILQRLPTPAAALRDVDDLSGSSQRELQEWGQQLVNRNYGRRTIPAFEVFAVAPLRID